MSEKPPSGLWGNRTDIPGGKYLVLRRDATIFDEPNFVLGPRDPAAPAALRTYADVGEALGWHPPFIADVLELALRMEDYRAQHGSGDPDRGPHRRDNPLVVEMMQRATRNTPAFAHIRELVSTARLDAECGNLSFALRTLDSLLELLATPQPTRSTL